MRKDPLVFWSRWLGFVGMYGVVMGALLVFTPIVEHTLGAYYYDVFFDGQPMYQALTPAARRFQAFVYGIAGALLVSWFWLVVALAKGPFRKGERWAWKAIAVSLIAWFVGDGYASIANGFAIHAAFNLSLLLVMGLPLAMTYRHIFAKRQEPEKMPSPESQKTPASTELAAPLSQVKKKPSTR